MQAQPIIHRNFVPVVGQRHNLESDRLTGMAEQLGVGDCMELDYGTAKSLVTRLRARQDGKRWSLCKLPDTTIKFGIWRRA